MQVHGEFSVENVLEKFKELRDERILKSEEHGWTNTPEQVNLKKIYIFRIKAFSTEFFNVVIIYL